MSLLVRVLMIACTVVASYLIVSLFSYNKGLPEVYSLKERLEAQEQANQKLAEINDKLEKEVMYLKSSDEAVEGYARHELGMIKEGEIFYQIVPKQE